MIVGLPVGAGFKLATEAARRLTSQLAFCKARRVAKHGTSQAGAEEILEIKGKVSAVWR